MSTVFADPASHRWPRNALQVVDPAAAVARTRPRTTIAETVSQTLSMAWRALKKMRRNPEQFFDVTLQPLLFTAMFAYIFGGAISGNVSSYLPLLIPGIVAQTVLTTCMATGVQLREDMDKGVFDRFKVAADRPDRPAGRAGGRRPGALPDRREPDVRDGHDHRLPPRRRRARRARRDRAVGVHRLVDRVDLHLDRHDRQERAERAGACR